MDVSALPQEQQQLYKLIIEANKQQTNEIKAEFQQTSYKIEATNKEIAAVKKRCIYLERKARKNNIVIFGMQIPREANGLLKHTLQHINALLGTDILEADINNFYKIGKSNKPPVVLEFISFLKKQSLFKNKENLKKLKNSGVSIANDLCWEDKEDQKVLRAHLKIARSQNEDARIIGHKLIINNVEFTAVDLKSIEKEGELRKHNEDSNTEEEEDVDDKFLDNTNHNPKSTRTVEDANTTLHSKPVVERKPANNKKIYKYSPRNTRSNKK